MATPKKPQSTMEQLVEILRDIVTEPMSDLSSLPPTKADVRRARSEMAAPAPRRKKAVKAKVKAKVKARPASKKKKPVVRRKKTKVARKKTTKRSKK